MPNGFGSSPEPTRGPVPPTGAPDPQIRAAIRGFFVGPGLASPVGVRKLSVYAWLGEGPCALLSALCLAGCVAEIEGPAPVPSAGEDRVVGGDPGQTPGDDDGGAPGLGEERPDGAPGRDCSGATVPADSARRLNVRELDLVAADVLGLDDRPFSPLGTDYGERVGAFLGTTERFVQDYFDVTESVAQRFVAAEASGEGCGDGACAVQSLVPALERLHRHPLDSALQARLTTLADAAFDDGASAEEAASLVLWSALNSPEFLLVGTSPDASGQLTGFELAERLALALWSSVPDAELLAAAADGSLDTEAGLEAQARRMLADPDKGARFLDGFVDAHFDLVSDTAIPPGLEPLDDGSALASDMRREADLLFTRVFEENRPIRSLISGDETFVNRRLARHYGLPEPEGAGFQPVSTEGSPRQGGLLTMGAVLAQEGDLIHRGVNVLQTFMCQPLVAPDPELLAAALDDIPGDATTRERVAYRTSDDKCSGCHALIDPIGAAYEVFDGAGRFRDAYPDGSSVLYEQPFLDGTIAGADDVSTALVEGRFSACFASQVLGWLSFRRLSLGPTGAYCATRAVLDAAGPEAGIQDLIVAAVLSDAFKTRVVD